MLLSHNHYDHLDPATLKQLVARDNPLIVTPLGNDTIVRGVIPGALATLPAMVALALAATSVLATVSYGVVERPFIRAGRRLTAGRLAGGP